MEDKQYGTLVQAIGPVLDVRFSSQTLPPLLTALKVRRESGTDYRSPSAYRRRYCPLHLDGIHGGYPAWIESRKHW